MRWSVGLQGQDSTSAWLSVESNLPASLVMIDSTYAGRAEGTVVASTPGQRTVALVPAEVGAWDLAQPQQTIELIEGDTLHLVIDFPYQYRIDSHPFGASVSLAGIPSSEIGKTPMLHTSDTVLTVDLLVSKDGYASTTITPGREVINRHSVVLVSFDGTVPDDLAVEWNPRGSSKKWLNWAAGALALGGGALAVHYKFKADEQYEEYLQTGDPALKETVDRYDAYSYVALGAMQVGVGVLAIRLAF